MKIVIDTSVLMAGLIKESIVRTILFSKNIHFFLPEYSINEIKKYESELIIKSGYDKEELATLINFLLENIELVPKTQIKAYMKTSEQIMKDIDIKDASFIATALSIKADGIWSFDKHFSKQKKVKIFDIAELINHL